MLKLGTVMHIGHPNVITLTFRRCDGGVTGYLADKPLADKADTEAGELSLSCARPAADG